MMKTNYKDILEQLSSGNTDALKMVNRGNKAIFEKYGLQENEFLILRKRNGVYYADNRTFSENEYGELLTAYKDDNLIKLVVIELTD